MSTQASMVAENLVLDSAGKAEWNAFVKSSPQGSVFSTSTYLDALDAQYSILVMREKSIIKAGIALPKVPFRGHTNPLYCKYLGILTTQTQIKNIAKKYSKFNKNIEAVCTELSGIWSFEHTFHPSFENWTPLYWSGFSQQTRYTYVMPLSRKDNWLSDANTRMRTAASRAERSGVTIEIVDLSDHEGIRNCYDICMYPYVSRGANPPLKIDKFNRMVDKLAPDNTMRLWLGCDEFGVAKTAAVILYDWKSAYFLMNGTQQDAPTGANSLLLKSAIEYAHDCGLDFDFEGSMIKPIEFFYRSFGPDRLPYHRIWRPTLVNSVKHLAMNWARKLLHYQR